MKLQIRDFTSEDLSALMSLLNEVRRGSFEFVPFTNEDIKNRMQEGKSRTLIAERDEEIVGTVTYNDGYWGEEIRWLAVRGQADRNAIEDVLVREVEGLVQKGSVFASVDAGSPRTEEWVRRGYTLNGGLYQMQARLSELRTLPTASADFRFGSMSRGEEKEVVAAVNAVFGWERLKLNFVEKGKVDSPPFGEEWVQVAYFGEKVASVVVAWPAVKFNAHFGAKRGYLGPAATVVEFRSKKLASVLTVRAMNFLYKRGFDQAVLHTSERNAPSVTLLRDVGFEIGHNIKFMRKTLVRDTQAVRGVIDEESQTRTRQ
jgi:ribosomal protein S18 acetylase RimI-like enzyme